MLQAIVGLVFVLSVLLGQAPADLFDDIFGSSGGSHADMPFEPAPQEPWKWPVEPLPELDPKNPTIPHLPPGHPGPGHPDPKRGEPKKACIGDTGICI